jgi:hypothetical protein
MEWPKTLLTPDEARRRIEILPESLSPIAEAARAAATGGAWIDDNSGALLAGYRLNKGKYHTYDVIIYPPLLRYRLDLYEKIHRFYMSENLIEILLYANGFCIMGLNIYGVPDSMAQDPPLLDRSRRAPIDISTGRLWRSNYAPANEDHFLFASKNVGNDGQMGYFISSTGQVVGRGNGSPEVAEQTGPWANVTDWLASEIG